MKQNARQPHQQAGRLRAAEIVALQEHRLEQDLTYRELARRVGLTPSKLHQLLNNPTVTANERTTFKVRRYLESVPRSERAAV